MKVCENCADTQRSATSCHSLDCEHVHMNEWEHMAKPTNLPGRPQPKLKTYKRLFDKPLEEHLRIADAFRLLSIRPYFARLWVC